MYKNFKLTDEERKDIMEAHKSHGYKKPLNEQAQSAQEEIDTDDEEAELRKQYDGDEASYNDELVGFDRDNGDYGAAFDDSDEYEDLYDLSVTRSNMPKDKIDDMGYSGTMDMDYKGSMHHDEIPGGKPKVFSWFDQAKPKTDTYYLDTYGTPDPDMESQTLADIKKNAPLNFPKMTGKDKYSHENSLPWEQKKALLAQREEKRIARELAKQAREGNMNESVIQLTESELVNLIKKIINEAK